VLENQISGRIWSLLYLCGLHRCIYLVSDQQIAHFGDSTHS